MLVFDDDDACDDDDVEEAPCVFMVRLKNDFDALDELLNEDSAFANTPFVVEEERRDEDLAAKTLARFAALLNMMRYLNQR